MWDAKTLMVIPMSFTPTALYPVGKDIAARVIGMVI